MSRKAIITILTCLLSLLPMLLSAQTLTRLEYWFDDDSSNRRAVNLSGTDFDVDTEISTQGLDAGLHKLWYRVRRSDGMYSPVSLSLFYKPFKSTQSLTRLEYWFDDESSNRRAINLSGTDFDVDTEISTQGLDAGLHKLWYRVRGSDGSYSPVSLRLFFKPIKSTQSLTRLEYWFDDESSNRRAVNLSGTDFDVDTEISTQGLDGGLHKLWYRVRGSDGSYSPISSTLFYKPIKSRYDVENPEELTVTEQAYWFDDEEPEYTLVSDPKNIITQPNKFDTRRLSDGQHTLHMRFGNSAGIWNGPVETVFTKKKVEPPVVVANASVESGVVTLKFNTVPNGHTYTIVRKYPSGTIRKLEDIKSGEYPVALQFTDTPAPGTYTYYVDAHYFDADDKSQKVSSNEVSVTVDQAAANVRKGGIDCVLSFDGKRTHIQRSPDYRVYINGVRARDAEYYYRENLLDNFRIGDIPYGTEITIRIEHEYYAFNEVKLIVDEDTRNQTYYFNGRSDENILPDNSTYDLIMYDKVHITPSAWEIEVKNKSNLQWKGYIDVLVINKKAKDKYDKRISGEETSTWEDMEDLWDKYVNKANYEDSPVYTEAASTLVTLEGKEYKVLSLAITDLPESDKNDDYYVYVFSRKEGTGLTKELQGTNPQVVTFNPFDCLIAIEKGFTSYMKVYAMVLKWMKKFSAWGDPLKLAWSSAGTAFDDYIKSLEDEEVDLEELNEDVADVAIRSAGMLLNCFFKDMHKAVKKHTKTIKDSDYYKINQKLSQFYNLVNSAYSAFLADDNQKFFKLANLVLKYSKQLGADPVLDCYKTFFEVGEAMANAAGRISTKISKAYVWDRLAGGNGIYHIKIRRYAPEGKFAGYFPGKDYYREKGSYDYHDGLIDNIEIKLINPINGTTNTSKPIGYDNIEFTDDGITLRNVKFYNLPDMQLETEAWMTIKWKNKRVTRIPLLDKKFVKIENFDRDVSVPLVMTVEFQSDTYMNKENIPNKLTFVEP